jgi:hypothetical protein
MESKVITNVTGHALDDSVGRGHNINLVDIRSRDDDKDINYISIPEGMDIIDILGEQSEARVSDMNGNVRLSTVDMYNTYNNVSDAPTLREAWDNAPFVNPYVDNGYSDFTIICGADETVVFHVSKYIIANASPVFRVMFEDIEFNEIVMNDAPRAILGWLKSFHNYPGGRNGATEDNPPSAYQTMRSWFAGEYPVKNLCPYYSSDTADAIREGITTQRAADGARTLSEKELDIETGLQVWDNLPISVKKTVGRRQYALWGMRAKYAEPFSDWLIMLHKYDMEFEVGQLLRSIDWLAEPYDEALFLLVATQGWIGEYKTQACSYITKWICRRDSPVNVEALSRVPASMFTKLLQTERKKAMRAEKQVDCFHKSGGGGGCGGGSSDKPRMVYNPF